SSSVRRFFSLFSPPPPISTLFPYTTLFRSVRADGVTPRQALHLALRGELPEGIDDALVANLKAGAEILDGHRLGGCRQQVEDPRSEEHTSELQSLRHLVCRLLLEKKKRLTR